MKCVMENMVMISKNIKAVNAPFAMRLIGNNAAFKYFALVLICVEVLLMLISKLCHSSITHSFVYSANMLAILVFNRTATTSTVPEETLQTTVRCENPHTI
jgi:hypothetical protein